MLETELRKEMTILEQQIGELRAKVDELRQVEDRIRHVQALLGDEEYGNEAGNEIKQRTRRGVNWAELCRENGLSVGGNSGHRVLLRQKPEIHASISHLCPYV